MQILKIVQIVIAISLMISILLQNRDSGAGGIFGGGGGGGNFSVRRGFEKKLFTATIILAIIFIVISIVSFLYS